MRKLKKYNILGNNLYITRRIILIKLDKLTNNPIIPKANTPKNNIIVKDSDIKQQGAFGKI